MQLNDLAVLPMAVLLLGVAMQGLLARVLSSKGKGWMAFGFACASLVAVAALWPMVSHGAVDLRLGGWDGPIALAYHVDGLSQLFALMGTGIGSAVLLFSVGYMAHDESATRFYIVMQIFIAALVNLVYSSNLLLMYAGWEIVGVCSFLLVGFWYKQREAAAGARKVLVITHVAGYALLVAILLLFARTGTLLWTDPRIGTAFTTGIFVLMFVAAMAKSVQFPLNTWIPFAMAAPTPVSALLHSACYVTAGVYLVARMHSFTTWPVAWQATVVWVGTVTMVVGILFAMIQRDAKRMLAYSTVSQIGYMMLGLGLGTPMGIIAGLLHCLNHGLFKGGLFLGAGSVQHATGTRDMDKLGGLKRRMPYTTMLWMVSAASIAGVPLFNGFVSKWLIYVAALNAGYAIPALVAWIVSILTMFTLMKATTAIFFGDDGEASASAHESPKVMLVGSGVLALGCVVLGIAPQLAVNYAVAPALASMGLHSDVVAGWFGISAAGSSFYTTAGLALALVSLVAGVAIYLTAMRRSRVAVATAPARSTVLAASGPAAGALAAVGGPVFDSGLAFTGGEPLTSRGRMRSSDFTASVARGLAPFYTWADPDRYLLAVWHATLSVCALVASVGEWLERHALLAAGGLAAVVGLIAALASGIARTASVAEVAAQPWPLAGAILVTLVALLLAQSAHADQRRHLWLALLCGVLVLAGLAVEQEYVRLALLESAAFGAVGLLVINGVEKRARNAYLGAAAISALALVAGTVLLPNGPAPVVLALLLVGFSVKLALVPAYLWLPAMARRTPAALVGLIVAVVDAAAFAELIALRQTAAWLFAPTWPWVLVALLTALGGAALMLAERDLKRMLAFSTMMGAGFVVLGVALAGPYGTAGALAAAAADSLAMGLLFTCLSAVETDGEGGPTLATRGLARRHPLASAAFVAGALTALGMPFTAGYAGHWRIYVAATGAGWLPLVCVVVATILAVLAYVRAIALVWWGGEDEAATARPWSSIWTSERAPLVGALTLLFVAVVAVGLVPRVL